MTSLYNKTNERTKGCLLSQLHRKVQRGKKNNTLRLIENDDKHGLLKCILVLRNNNKD